MPLGKPEYLAENFDRWGADEIVLLCIDRDSKGPDLNLIRKIGELGLTTPFCYGGGIRNRKDAIEVINSGAERIVLDSLIFKKSSEIEYIAKAIGIQAILASLPLIQMSDGSIMHFNHVLKEKTPLSLKLKELIRKEKISEIILIDKEGEGSQNGFNNAFISKIKSYTSLPILVFGGIVNEKQISKLLSISQVSGILIGNSLNYKEHAINKIKNSLNSHQIRMHNINNLR